ncbi:MAG: YbjN domain-containing protein [Parvularculaceae bacterium]
MRVLLGVLAAGFLAVASISPAHAGPISKAEIAEILSDQGYAVRDFSPSMVAVVAGEHVILVGVDGADGDITYLTYISGVDIGALGYKFLSNFNSEVKFGRAYVDSDGDVAIQMDRNAAGGVSAENVESDFDVFLLLIAKFLSDVENQPVA